MKSQFAIDLIPQAQKRLKSLGFSLQKYWLELALISAGSLGLWLGSQQLPLLTQSQQLQTSISTLQENLSKASLPDKERLSLEKDLLALQKDKITLENTIRTNQLQGIGGALLVITAYVGWRNYQATQQKQVAERFSKAVEQLGNDNIHVRLGGIYALEQIAKDAEEKYYWQVMETLTAYVRERSLYRPEPEEKPRTLVESVLQSQTPPVSKETPQLATDIQAVMTVLARRKHNYLNGEEHRLDLRKTNLKGLQLPPHANLKGVDFWNANLESAELRNASLQEVLLGKANLQEADLIDTNLQGASLGKANLQKAYLAGANLQKAYLVEANLQEAILVGANLQGAKFVEANLQGAYLWGANLQKAGLWRANLQGAKLRKVESADPLAIAYSADVIGLTWKQLQEAESYEGAELPDYLLQNPPAKAETPSTEEARQPGNSSR